MSEALPSNEGQTDYRYHYSTEQKDQWDASPRPLERLVWW